MVFAFSFNYAVTQYNDVYLSHPYLSVDLSSTTFLPVFPMRTILSRARLRPPHFLAAKILDCVMNVLGLGTVSLLYPYDSHNQYNHLHDQQLIGV